MDELGRNYAGRPTPLTLAFVETWYRYFLMPRRTAVDARWIICYGCEVSKLGRPYAILWQDDSIGDIHWQSPIIVNDTVS